MINGSSGTHIGAVTTTIAAKTIFPTVVVVSHSTAGAIMLSYARTAISDINSTRPDTRSAIKLHTSDTKSITGDMILSYTQTTTVLQTS